MTSKRVAPRSSLSPSVEALVAHERLPPPQPADVRARLLSRAEEATLQGPPPPPSPRGAPTGIAQPLLVSSAVVAAGIVAALYFTGPATPSAPPRAGASVASATPAGVPAHAAPVAVSSPAPEAPLSATPPTAVAETSASPLRPAASSRREAGLEEIELLSRARHADARGDYAGVLSTTAEHERLYPSGRLSEEREVLRVKALVKLGRADPARRAAAKFHRRFPESVLLHKVDEMLASMP
jgi:hypothetical protein